MTMQCAHLPRPYILAVVAYGDPDLAVTPSTGRMHVHGKVVDTVPLRVRVSGARRRGGQDRPPRLTQQPRRHERRIPAPLDDARRPPPRRCRGSASRRPSRGRSRARGLRPRGTARAAAAGRASTAAGRSASRRSRGRPARASASTARRAIACAASRATRRRPRSRRAGSSRSGRGRRSPAAGRRPRTARARCPRRAAASVGAGGAGRVHSSSIACRSRNGAGRVTRIQPRTPRTGTSCGQRAADAPRPRPGGHDDVRRPRCGRRR